MTERFRGESSEGLLVEMMLPWLKSALIEATWAPSPIWRGSVPPFELEGADPKLSVLANWVENCTCEALKPFVPAFAILLPSTPISVSLSDNPFNAVLRAELRPIMTPPGR